jgi:hypothetical protein
MIEIPVASSASKWHGQLVKLSEQRLNLSEKYKTDEFIN